MSANLNTNIPTQNAALPVAIEVSAPVVAKPTSGKRKLPLSTKFCSRDVRSTLILLECDLRFLELLQIVEALRPSTAREWEKIREIYCDWATSLGRRTRTAQFLKSKFMKVVEGNAAPSYRNIAARIQEKINHGDSSEAEEAEEVSDESEDENDVQLRAVLAVRALHAEHSLETNRINHELELAIRRRDLDLRRADLTIQQEIFRREEARRRQREFDNAHALWLQEEEIIKACEKTIEEVQKKTKEISTSQDGLFDDAHRRLEAAEQKFAKKWDALKEEMYSEAGMDEEEEA